MPLTLLNFQCRKTKSSAEINSVIKFELENSYDLTHRCKSQYHCFLYFGLSESDFEAWKFKFTNFKAIANFNIELEQKNYSAHLIFLVLLLKIQGIEPLSSSFYFLDPETGKLLFRKKTSSFYQRNLFDLEKYFRIWKSLRSKNCIIGKKSNVRQYFWCIITIILATLEFPNSLEIIQQIYE